MLILGTVQLGMSYGRFDGGRAPGDDDAVAVLDGAWAHGVRALDTAAAYGEAERRIGLWLGRAPDHAGMEVISKFPDLAPAAQPAEALAASLDQSLARLGRARLDGYLAHRPVDLSRPGVIDVLRRAKDSGTLAAFGASVYDSQAARTAMAFDGVSLLQIPFSILNQEAAQAGLLDECRQRGVAVHVRSVFVQGLLLQDPDTLPAYAAEAAPVCLRLRGLAAELGMDILDLALLAARDTPGVDSVVVGVHTTAQLAAIAAAHARPPLDPAARDQAMRIAAGLPAAVVDPSQWPK